jgi:hypothetical protein
MGDLRSRRRHQVAEHRRRDVLLRGLQPAERPLEVGTDDRLRAAQLPERREVEHRRAALPLCLPQPLEDELEVRRLDAFRVRLDPPAARLADVDASGGNLVQDRVHELRLDAHVLARQLVVAFDRPEDRGSRAFAVEVVEPQVVREEVRDLALERVELGQSVLAQAE